MRDLDFLVPSALVAPGLATDLFAGVALPNLGRVLAQAGSRATWRLPEHASLTTWQAWIYAERAGVPVDAVNVGELWARAAGCPPASDGGRWVLEPAHFQVARDHLRLTDPRGLAPTLAEARELALAAEPILRDDGWTLAPIASPTTSHWLVSRTDGLALSGAAIDRAIGDNVATWQPRGRSSDAAADDAASLAWRRCVNEIQMAWFDHPVNAVREADGRPAINTLWLSGNGRPRTPSPRYAAVISTLPLVAALSGEPDAPRDLETFDRLVEPALRDDWSTWRETLGALDARIGELLERQATRDLGAVTFAFCGRGIVRHASVAPSDLRKFWRRWSSTPSLADWFVDGSIDGSIDDSEDESVDPVAR